MSDGGIPENSNIQAWRSGYGKDYKKWQDYVAAKASVKGNFKVINSLGNYAYFDYRNYSGGSKPSWVPALPMKRVYKFPVIPAGLSADEAENIIGGECTIWTEYLITKILIK